MHLEFEKNGTVSLGETNKKGDDKKTEKIGQKKSSISLLQVHRLLAKFGKKLKKETFALYAPPMELIASAQWDYIFCRR